MDIAFETWKAKISNKESQKINKSDTVSVKGTSSNASRMSKPSKTSRRKKFKCKKLKNASMAALSKNAQNNCCTCCGLLMEYLREVKNLVCSGGCPDGQPRIAEVLKDLMDVAGCICHDCYSALKIILKFLFIFRK